MMVISKTAAFLQKSVYSKNSLKVGPPNRRTGVICLIVKTTTNSTVASFLTTVKPLFHRHGALFFNTFLIVVFY